MILLAFSNLRPHFLTLALVLPLLLFALTACKVEVNFSIDEEGSGEIEIVGAVNDTVMALANLGTDDPLEELFEITEEEMDGSGITGSTIERYSQGGYTGVKINVDFDAYDPVVSAFSEGDSILGELTEQSDTAGFNFTRTAEDDGWVVELRRESTQTDLPDLPDVLDDVPFDLDDLNLPFIISLQLPGQYIEHNADREVDGVLFWEEDLLDGIIDVYVVSRDSGSEIEWVPIIISVIFATVFGGIVIGVVVSRERRRRRLAEDVEMDAESSAEAEVVDEVEN